MFVVGGQNQLKLFGRPALGEVLTFAPALDQFLKAHLFGDIFSRDNLTGVPVNCLLWLPCRCWTREE